MVAALLILLLSVTSSLSSSAQARSQTRDARQARLTSSTSSTLLARILANLAGTAGFRGLPLRGGPTSAPRPVTGPVTSGSASTAPATGTGSAPTGSTATATTPSTPASGPTGSGPTGSTGSAPTGSAPVTTTPPAPAPTPTSTPPTDGGRSLLWSDEFNGPAGSMANSGVWERINGGYWGNGELECYSDGSDYSSMDGNGSLVLTARYTPNHKCMYGATNNYTSARLSSDKRAITASHGSIRVRAKLPVAQGVWPAIWALGQDNDSIGWPNAGEIDMAEAIGQSQTMYGNIHFPSNQGPAGLGTGYTLSSPMNTTFHVYGVDWSPTSVQLSVDDHVYKTITKADVTAAGGTWVFDRPFFVLLNIAVGGTWPGNPKDNSVFPQSMTVDYVRVYS